MALLQNFKHLHKWHNYLKICFYLYNFAKLYRSYNYISYISNLTPNKKVITIHNCQSNLTKIFILSSLSYICIISRFIHLRITYINCIFMNIFHTL